MKVLSAVLAVFVCYVFVPAANAQENDQDSEMDRLQRRVEALEEKIEGNPHEAAPYEWVSPLRWESDDERFSMSIKGRLQPRYEYRQRDARRSVSEFTFRRLRLDLQGHALSENLTYRFMPELQGGYSLRDAWVNYEFMEGHALRVGQFNIPAFFERTVSSNRHALTERSLANDIFQWPTGGRDIGLMKHGSAGELAYGVGFFGGEGRNDAADPTSGHMYSGRVSYTFLGDYPRSLNLVEPIDGSNLAVGVGGYYANNNALAEEGRWDHSPANFDKADVGSSSVDITFQHDRITATLQGFYWKVDPRNAVRSFYGSGYTAEAGYLIKPETLFVGLRHSSAKPNHSEGDGMDENSIGLQWYLMENRSKFYFEHTIGNAYLDGSGRGDRDNITTVQYQLLF